MPRRKKKKKRHAQAKKKIKRRGNVAQNRKRQKKKKNKSNLKKLMCRCTWAFLSIKTKNLLSLSFFSILKRKYFDESEKKTHESYNLFFFLSYLTKHAPIKFLFQFSLKNFHSSHPNKHTFKSKICRHKQAYHWTKMII